MSKLINPQIFKPEHFANINIPPGAISNIVHHINENLLPGLFSREFSNPKEGTWVLGNDPFYTHTRYVSKSYEMEPKKFELTGHVSGLGSLHLQQILPEYMDKKDVKITVELVEKK